MLLTYKRKIKLTLEQEQILLETAHEATYLYNELLSKKNEYYKEHNKYLKYYDQQATLKDYDTKYLTYDMKKEICRQLDNSYKSFFGLLNTTPELKPHPPKYRSIKYFFTLSYVQDFIVIGNTLRLSNKHCKYIDIPFYNKFNDERTKLRNKSKNILKVCKIFYDDVERNYYASICYDTEVDTTPKQTKKYLAIDLGKKNIVTYYDETTNTGCTFNSSKYYENEKHFDKRIDELKSLLSKKQINSRSWKKINRKKKQLCKKRSKQNKLALHKLSKEISKLDRHIIIGDLTNLKSNIISDYRKLNRQMQNNWQLMTFVAFLEYKCKKEGTKLTKVNEAWTSKTCYKCGNINYGLTPAHRTYKCEKCGQIIDRDVNGSINILKVYKQTMGDYSTPVEPSCSERLFGNVRKVNSFQINLD